MKPSPPVEVAWFCIRNLPKEEILYGGMILSGHSAV